VETNAKNREQTLDAFFDLGELPFSGIIIIDENGLKWAMEYFILDVLLWME